MTAPPNQQIRKEISRNATASPSGSVIELGRTSEVGIRTGTCPTCGGPKLYVLPPRRRKYGVGCWRCCPPETSDGEAAEWLAQVAAILNCKPSEILADAPEYLDLTTYSAAGVPRLPRDLTIESVDRWVSVLWSVHPRPLDWLRERGLTDATIRAYRLGYDGDRDALTFPVFDAAGKVVNVRRRFLRPSPGTPKMLPVPGCGAQLYPLSVLDADPSAVVVCEGERDALLLNQHGIPALTSTASVGGWSKYSHWTEYFVGRSIAVMYDAGALFYERAEARAQALVAAGARDAWPVDLTLVGFTEGEDVGDWFVTYGWDADALRKFINESRRWYREDVL